MPPSPWLCLSRNKTMGLAVCVGKAIAALEHKMAKKVRQKTCFVIRPIGDLGSPTRGHADWLLDEIIAPIFDEHFKDFEVIRSDKITQPGMIDSQVINNLLDADLVIADMSLLNANAFYEMGLRHMERKPIIHMFRAGETIPFDVKPYRAIPFAFEHPKQRFEARDHLKQAVDAVFAEGYQVENLVTRARGYAELSRHATPEMEVVLAELESLKNRIRVAEAMAEGASARAAMLAGSPPGLFIHGAAPITTASLFKSPGIGDLLVQQNASTNASLISGVPITVTAGKPGLTLTTGAKPKK
jgi:hypothetical protein